MHNFSSTSERDTTVGGVDLYRAWDVDQGPDYVIPRPGITWDGEAWSRPPQPGTIPLIAARTTRGQGVIVTRDGTEHAMVPGSLLIMPWSELELWRTDGPRWCFYWFEFFAGQAEHFEPYRPMTIPFRDAEQNQITQIIRLLRRPEETDRRLAAARFVALAYQWMSQRAVSPGTDPPHRARIERAIDLMHDRVDQNLPIPEIARAVGLSPRTFASTFERFTGQPPKRYFNSLRLQAARTLLSTGRHNVQQTAELLGFSSPFHLSRAYKKHFGHPPSQAG